MANPMDTALICTRVMRTNEISPTSLLDENVELNHNMNCSHLNIQILRIITPNNGSNTSTMKYQQGRFSQNITLIRIIMCRHEDNVYYIMINHEHNRRLFHRYLSSHWGPRDPSGVQSSLYVCLSVSLSLCPVFRIDFWRSFLWPIIARSAPLC